MEHKLNLELSGARTWAIRTRKAWNNGKKISVNVAFNYMLC